jgi:hypothetical protein
MLLSLYKNTYFVKPVMAHIHLGQTMGTFGVNIDSLTIALAEIERRSISPSPVGRVAH